MSFSLTRLFNIKKYPRTSNLLVLSLPICKIHDLASEGKMLKFYNLSSKNGASLSFFPFSWLSDPFGFFLMCILIDKFLLMKILSVLLRGHKSHHYFFFT